MNASPSLTVEQFLSVRRAATWRAVALFCSLFGTALSGAGEWAPLRLVNGQRWPARLQQWSFATDSLHWEIEAAPGGERREMETPIGDCIAWGGEPDQPTAGAVYLVGGSVLAGELTGIVDQEVRVQTSSFGRVSIPRRLVAGLLVRPPLEPRERDRLATDLATPRRGADEVLLLHGDVLAGRLRADEEGIATTQSVSVGDSGAVARLDQVLAARLGGDLPNTPSAEVARVHLAIADGSRLAVTEWQRTEAGCRLTLVGGVPLDWPDPDWPQRLVGVRPGTPATTILFLSDLPPVGFKQLPFLGGEWPLGVDHHPQGGSLRYRGRIVEKGLGMHATSRVAFEVPEKATWLDGELALDDSAGTRGSVVYRIYGQVGVSTGQASWTMLYESGVVRGGDEAIPIHLPIAGMARVALVVDAADRGDEGDDANILWMRFRREE